MLHFFSLSRVSHKGEFYLERFLVRQHCTSISFLCYMSFDVISVILNILYFFVNLKCDCDLRMRMRI